MDELTPTLAAGADTRASAASACPRSWPVAGTRVRVTGAPGYNPFAIGELGTVWCSDRTGAVVTLDSRGVADTRFALSELEPAEWSA